MIQNVEIADSIHFNLFPSNQACNLSKSLLILLFKLARLSPGFENQSIIGHEGNSTLHT